MREDTGPGRPRAALGAFLLAAFAGLLPAASPPGVADDEKIEDVRGTLEQMVETRRIISKEKRDWALGQEMLNDRIELVQREIDTLRDKIAAAEAEIDKADDEKMALVEENERLKQASIGLSGTIRALEQRTRDLLARLPDPIQERVRVFSQQLPEDPDDTRLSLGLRFQNVVGILNEVNKFNREITATSEVRTLGDGTTAEVTAIYIGLGQAYYASGTEDAAGIGTSSADGWVWTPADHAAGAVALAIAILQNEEVASFVPLPVDILEEGE